jgi:hypothetical protein
MKAKTTKRKAVAKKPSKRRNRSTITDVLFELKVMRMDYEHRSSGFSCVASDLSVLRSYIAKDLHSLHETITTLREHLAVSASNCRRLMADKETLQAVIDDQRKQIAGLKASAAAKAPASAGPSLEAMQECHAQGWCYPCGWKLATDKTEGCMPGDCSYRPEPASVEYIGWRERMQFERNVRAGVPIPEVHMTCSEGVGHR